MGYTPHLVELHRAQTAERLINAEIHLGRRTVLEYLLSPIEKVAHKAGRER